MPCVNDTELAKTIRTGDISSLYYFYGKDIATIELYAKRLVSKLVKKEDQTYNLHTFNGKELDLSELSDVCNALPMFSDRICITINDLDADELNEDDYKFLCDILSDIPETTTVIIYITGVILYNKKNILKTKNKKFITFAGKQGYSCEFIYKKPAELVKVISDRINNNGSTISKASAEYLASQCLSNLMLINNEIDKLCDYSNGKEITNEIIDLLVSKQLDSNSFALAKAAAQFNAKKSMQLLDELYSQQVDSIAILSAISMSFIDLYRARLAKNSGASQADVIADFNYKSRDFVVKNAFRDCASIPVERLRKCISILSDADIALKSSRTAQRLIIEQAINSMLIK